VFGMPRAAQRLDAVDQQLPLGGIAAAVLRGALSRASVAS
jgi:chemotaxis response regulator CheB